MFRKHYYVGTNFFRRCYATISRYVYVTITLLWPVDLSDLPLDCGRREYSGILWNFPFKTSFICIVGKVKQLICTLSLIWILVLTPSFGLVYFTVVLCYISRIQCDKALCFLLFTCLKLLRSYFVEKVLKYSKSHMYILFLYCIVKYINLFYRLIYQIYYFSTTVLYQHKWREGS